MFNQLDKTYNVLFISSKNSARSILAEALMNHLGEGRFKAWSAGPPPSAAVNPLALKELEALRLPTRGLRSKALSEYMTTAAPGFDFVFAISDEAAGESCPVWPAQPLTAHWGIPDPARSSGTEAERLNQFKNAAIALRRRIELLLALPVQRLDELRCSEKLGNER